MQLAADLQLRTDQLIGMDCNITNVMQCTPYNRPIEKTGAHLARSGSVSDRKSLHAIS